MHKALKSSVAAFALVGAVFAGAGAATAADVGVSVGGVGVAIDLGDVAIGYNDGYWDKTHHWHEWKNTDHRDAYKGAKDSEFHDWQHDRDPDQGWHEPKKGR